MDAISTCQDLEEGKSAISESSAHTNPPGKILETVNGAIDLLKTEGIMPLQRPVKLNELFGEAKTVKHSIRKTSRGSDQEETSTTKRQHTYKTGVSYIGKQWS